MSVIDRLRSKPRNFRRLILSLCATLTAAIACDSGVTEPTVAGATRSTVSERLAAALSSISLAGPAPGCQPATERVEWVVTVSSPPELVRLYPSAFRDPKAGCDSTTHSLALMTVDGPSHYFTGQSGQTRFIFEAGRATCGRVAVGVIYKDVDEHDTMLSWRVVNTGVDCPVAPNDPPPGDPPPPPPPPLPPPPPPPGPPPDACAGPWTYTGPNPFSLPNAGEATQLAYVREHVSALLVGPEKTSLTTTQWTSDGNYPVVIVKSSTSYALHVNVRAGQVLPTPSTNHNGKPQDISHVSRFVCQR